MHNLWTVIWFEFIRTLKKKTFWLSILAIPTLMAVVFGVMYLSSNIAEEASKEQQAKGFRAVILDNSGVVRGETITSIKAQTVPSKEEGIRQVEQEKVDAFIYYPADLTKNAIEIYAIDAGLIENTKYTAVAEQLLRNSAALNINSPQLIAITEGQIHSKLTTYTNGQLSPGLERAIAPGVFLVLFYALIILLANQMLTSTTEEKENRVIEMILTTVQARTLIIGKILALIMLGVIQIAVILIPTIIAYHFGSDTLAANMPAIDLGNMVIDWGRVAVGASLFAVSFLLFTGVLVSIGAAVPTAKEANNFFGAVVLAMLIPMYTSMAIVSDPSQLIVRLFSFFPLTAPVTLMLRNAVGNLSTIEAIIGWVILAVSAGAALSIATHTFKYGTLEYNRKLSLKEILGIR